MTDRHTTRRLEATKEYFYPFLYGTGGAAQSALGGHVGWSIDGDAQYVYAECYIPWDFVKLTEAVVALLAQANLEPMTFRVVTDFCRTPRAYFEGNNQINCEINTITNFVHECSISPAMVDLDSGMLPQPKEYLGVQVSRQAGQNANAIFLGVRLRYNTPTYATIV
jgi:hypothetical protein